MLKLGFFLKHLTLLFVVAIAPTTALDIQQQNERQQLAIEQREFKKAIEIQHEKINHADAANKAEYHRELALLYLKDQDQEKAIIAFLEALSLKPNTPTPATTAPDEAEYKKAFAIYLDPTVDSPKATAINLLKALKPVLDAKPDQYLLDYFMAIAYANLGRYEEFFVHFYRAYQFYPAHYLAFKTKAVMHIKLLERASEENQRGTQRQLVTENLMLALEQEPLDTSIYRLLISFSPKEKKREQVQLCLNKIINGNIMIPRSELMFYVMEAVDVSDRALAQRFIDRSKEWYPQSRIVTSAQNYLDP